MINRMMDLYHVHLIKSCLKFLTLGRETLGRHWQSQWHAACDGNTVISAEAGIQRKWSDHSKMSGRLEKALDQHPIDCRTIVRG